MAPPASFFCKSMYQQSVARLFTGMTNTTKGTLAERLAPIREQQAHQADVRERGLAALLAPYSMLDVLPKQRTN